MAQKLLKYYEQVKKIGGLKAQMRLAVLTKMPSVDAEKKFDSAENIALFEKAVAEIRKEFN